MISAYANLLAAGRRHELCCERPAGADEFSVADDLPGLLTVQSRKDFAERAVMAIVRKKRGLSKVVLDPFYKSRLTACC